MDSEDGEHFIKQLAIFVRTHEKALANALQFQRREVRHRSSQSTSAVTIPQSPRVPERPSTSSSTSSSLAAAFSLGALHLTSHSVKSAKLALTPHHLFFLLSRFEDLGINVGPMKVRLENIHDNSSSNYVSFLGNSQRTRSRGSDVGSIHSVSSVRSAMSGMSAFWNSFGIGASISAARNERQKAAIETDLKYLYSAFTKIPCLKLAPDWRARLIRGYEEFPFDSAVPIHVFKNLQALEVNSLDFRQFFGWDRLADQLRSLTLRHAGVEDPADILIDIVLDDMDKRRRRTSKSQSSPTATWVASNSPRRSPVLATPELGRTTSVPGSPEHRVVLTDLRLASLAQNEPVVEDSETSDTTRPSLSCEDGEEFFRSNGKMPRPRSISPSRPTSDSRNLSAQSRSSQQRVRRSGSGSSNSSLSESWHHHARSSSSNLLISGFLPASKWRFLRHLSLSDNAMTSIHPSGLAPLTNTLHSLDLSSNLFTQIPDSLATLTSLRALNLSNCMIDSLQSLTRHPLPAITALNLRANRLQSLAGAEKLFPLERLDLRDNRLADPLELARLTGIPDIREIWLEGNPLTRTHKDYRVTIFNLFRSAPGYTEDVVIDGTGPSYSEKRFLVERASLPDLLPVVKPKFPDGAAVVDVGKAAIVHNVPREYVPRKERPMPKMVTSEVNASSRRRKVSKRRIVDLATRDVVTPSTSADALDNVDLATTSPDVKCSAPATTDKVAQPSVVLTNNRKSPSASPAMELMAAQTPSPDAHRAQGSTADQSEQDKRPDWNASGENYRRKIEALRDQVGTDYLSVLGEESRNGKNDPFLSSAIPSVAAFCTTSAPNHSFDKQSSAAWPRDLIHLGREPSPQIDSPPLYPTMPPLDIRQASKV